MTADVKTPVTLRPLMREDAELVFGWRNMPEIVARATSARPVVWDEHVRWIEETVTASKRRAFIVETDGKPVGQTRFDRSSDSECVISVYLIPGHLGHGVGKTAIDQGCAAIFAEWPVREVIACVQHGNERGRGVFRKCGFVEFAEPARCPGMHYTFVLSRQDFEKQAVR